MSGGKVSGGKMSGGKVSYIPIRSLSWYQQGTANGASTRRQMNANRA